jgi:hypothetical protein
LPSVVHRTQFMRILLTQFIATLAPWKSVVSDQLSVTSYQWSVVSGQLSVDSGQKSNDQRLIEYLQFIIYNLT